MFTELLGVAGMALGLSSYLARSHKELCFVVAAALTLLGGHYLLLGALTASALYFFSAVRWCTASWVVRQDRATRLVCTSLALGAIFVITAFTWGGPASAFPLVGNVIIVVASNHMQERQLRWGLLASEFMWAATAISAGSVPGLALAICGMLLGGWMLAKGRGLAPQASAPLAPSGCPNPNPGA